MRSRGRKKNFDKLGALAPLVLHPREAEQEGADASESHRKGGHGCVVVAEG